ncbi:MAG: hypothetical protein ACYTXC_04925 [Nostoc sp.]
MYSKNLTTTPLGIESNLKRLRTDNLALLRSHGLAEYNTPEEIAFAMGISLGKLSFLTTSRPTSPITHYLRFKISKKTGSFGRAIGVSPISYRFDSYTFSQKPSPWVWLAFVYSST